MTKHGCPDCQCEEAPECAESHCLHPGLCSTGMDTFFCCRCPYVEVRATPTASGSSVSFPPPGCKLKLEVY